MLRPVHDVENVVGDEAFWTAFVVAVLGAAAVWFRMRRGEREPGFAIVVLVAGLVGLRVEVHRLPAALVVGLSLLVLGECVGRDASWVVRFGAFVPGALALGASLPDGWPFWSRVVVAGVAVIGGLLAIATDQYAPRLLPVLLAIGALGVYVCVPDTEAPKALFGALLGTVVLALAAQLRHRIGIAAVTGLFAWTTALGGIGRSGSIVGGVACLGAAVLVPLLPRWSPNRVTVAITVVVQVALVAFVARVAGFEESGWSALLFALPAFAVAWAILAQLRRPAQ
jgi:hypothetical protein